MWFALCVLDNFSFMSFLLSANFFSKSTFSKNSFKVSNGMDPDQDRHFVGPDLGPNCLQRLSTNHMSPLARNLTVKN